MKLTLSTLLLVALSADAARHGAVRSNAYADQVAVKERNYKNSHSGRSHGLGPRVSEIAAVKESRAHGAPSPRLSAQECRDKYDGSGPDYIDGDGVGCDLFDSFPDMCDDMYNTPASDGCTPLQVCDACCKFIYPHGQGFEDGDGADCGDFEDNPHWCDDPDYHNPNNRGCDAETVCDICH